MENGEEEKKIFFKAVVAEKLEQPEKVISFIKQLIPYESKEDQITNNEFLIKRHWEENYLQLISIGYRNLIDKHRDNLRKIFHYQKKCSESEKKLLSFYFNRFQVKALNLCFEFIDILENAKIHFEKNENEKEIDQNENQKETDKNEIQKDKENKENQKDTEKNEKDMNLIECYKLSGDFYRYICEIISHTNKTFPNELNLQEIIDPIQKAQNNYKVAADMAQIRKTNKQLAPTDILYLTILLNTNIFFYEFQNQKSDALTQKKIALQSMQALQEETTEALKTLPFEEIKNLTEILNIIEENIETWKTELKTFDQVNLIKMSKSLLCKIHKNQANFVCEIQNCSFRNSCNDCLKTEHYQQHKYNIVNLTEFLYEQNKNKRELIESYENRLLEVKRTIQSFEEFVVENSKDIDRDFGEIKLSFDKMWKQAQNYLKDHISKDPKSLIQLYNDQKENFRQLKQNIGSQNQQNDFIINFQQENFEIGIEKLINKNSQVNLELGKMRRLEETVKNSFSNKVYYNLNDNTQMILKDLMDIFSTLMINFWRKFRMLLVRPSFEEELKMKITMIRNKIFKEFLPTEEQQRESIQTQSSLNLSMVSNLFLNLKEDLEIISPAKLKYPEHVIILTQSFGEFSSPKQIDHIKFKDLIAKPCVQLEDNSFYEGQWSSNSTRTGKGICIFSDGTFYNGYWIDGVPQILGRFIYPEGTLYEGLVKDGKPNGKGVKIDLNGYKYVGYWKDNQKHGQGEEIFENQTKYTGIFFYDQHHGKGKLELPNKACYEGEFFEGKFEGNGKFVWPNGEEYEGQWSEDMKHGKGVYKHKDGRIYEGDFVNDMPHGFGKLIQKNGEILEGFWNKGNPTGIALSKELETQNAKSIFVSEIETNDPNLSIIDKQINNEIFF